MTFIFISLTVTGLLIFLSQTSYTRIAGEMYGYRDLMAIPRLRHLQKRADMIHCIHHSVHAMGGLMIMAIAISFLWPSAGIPVGYIAASACLLLLTDAVIYLVNNLKHNLSARRDEIQRKWKSEKVFGPEHDDEVSLFRTLTELTTKNLIRDLIHAIVFVGLALCHSLAHPVVNFVR